MEFFESLLNRLSRSFLLATAVPSMGWNMQYTHKYTSLIILLAFTTMGGCGKSSLLDGVVPVSGKVTYQGQPVDGAIVTFIPLGTQRAATGRTDASGLYRLSTLEADDGAMPGDYQVTIAKTEVSGTRDSEEDAPPPVINSGLPPIYTKELVPVKYKNAQLSGLTAQVSDSGANELSFDLEN